MSSNYHHQPHRRPRLGPWPPGSTPVAAAAEPLSWAKRTGFKGRVSGESNASMNSGQIILPKSQNPEPRTPSGSRVGPVPSPPVAAHPPAHPPPVNGEAENKPAVDPTVKRQRDFGGAGTGPTKNVTNGPARPNLQQQQHQPHQPQQRHRRDEGLPHVQEEEGIESRQLHINYELRDRPGLVPIVFYGVQHYLSILGSLILIPLVIVPAMGGAVVRADKSFFIFILQMQFNCSFIIVLLGHLLMLQEDTAAVVSIVLFISGVTTIASYILWDKVAIATGAVICVPCPIAGNN